MREMHTSKLAAEEATCSIPIAHLRPIFKTPSSVCSKKRKIMFYSKCNFFIYSVSSHTISIISL